MYHELSSEDSSDSSEDSSDISDDWEFSDSESNDDSDDSFFDSDDSYDERSETFTPKSLVVGKYEKFKTSPNILQDVDTEQYNDTKDKMEFDIRTSAIQRKQYLENMGFDTDISFNFRCDENDWTKCKLTNLKKVIYDKKLKPFGQGGFGKLYQAKAITKKNKEIDVAVKVILVKYKDKEDYNDSLSDLYIEDQYNRYMATVGIGPTVYDSYYTVREKEKTIKQVFIMDKYDSNCSLAITKFYIKKDLPKIGLIVQKMVNLLYRQAFEYDLICIDIKTDNYVFRDEGTVVKMIDFGSDWCNVENQSNKLLRFLLLVCQLSSTSHYNTGMFIINNLIFRKAINNNKQKDIIEKEVTTNIQKIYRELEYNTNRSFFKDLIDNYHKMFELIKTSRLLHRVIQHYSLFGKTKKDIRDPKNFRKLIEDAVGPIDQKLIDK